MKLAARIAKLFRRRNRSKGQVARQINRGGRNRIPLTAIDLWSAVYRFKETPPARSGVKRARARMAAKARNQRKRWWQISPIKSRTQPTAAE